MVLCLHLIRSAENLFRPDARLSEGSLLKNRLQGFVTHISWVCFTTSDAANGMGNVLDPLEGKTQNPANTEERRKNEDH